MFAGIPTHRACLHAPVRLVQLEVQQEYEERMKGFLLGSGSPCGSSQRRQYREIGWLATLSVLHTTALVCSPLLRNP